MNAKQIQAICSRVSSKIYVYEPGKKISADCDVVIVEKNSRQSLNDCHILQASGWKIFKGDSGYTYVKDINVLNALKNPEKKQIALEKPAENAIIDTAKVEVPVGTTPDPAVIFPEKDEKEKPVEKKEKPSYKSMKKKW